MTFLRQIIRRSRIWLLLDTVLLYSLGGGIAHYLGGMIDWPSYFAGLGWVLTLQLGATFLYEHLEINRGVDHGEGSPREGQGALARTIPGVLFWVGSTCLAVTASLTVLLMRVVGKIPEVYLIMGLIFVVAYLTSMIPSTAPATSYRAVLFSFGLANLVPGLAFLLQYGEFHRLLAMATFPLTTLHLAMLLAFELPRYGANVRYERPTLLVRLGWRRGMLLHNLLILVSFILLVLAGVSGLPAGITYPPLFVLPLGLIQIWQMNRIEQGARPNWSVLLVLAAATFGLTAYLLTYAFWTR